MASIFSNPGVRWPLGVIGILLVSFIVCGITIYYAVTDSSYAVEPEYYEQAVRWDESVKEREASAALGWDAAVSITLEDGEADLRVELLDAQGQPVEGATVVCSAFQYARRGEAFDGSLNELDSGAYRVSFLGAAPGQWQVRVRAMRGDDVFLTRVDVPTAEAAR